MEKFRNDQKKLICNVFGFGECGASAPMDAMDSWRQGLLSKEPTSNMMRWMSGYDEACPFTCCRSEDCAMIQCTGCLKSLTALGRAQTRYQCMQCPVEERPDTVSRRPELCEDCFVDPSQLHWHGAFCKVNGRGQHEVAHRIVGVAEMHTVSEEDLTFLPTASPALEKEACCAVCCEEFCDGFSTSGSDGVVPRCPPGCSAGHGDGFRHPKLGVQDLGLQCGACWMRKYQMADMLTCCRVDGAFFPAFCSLCEFKQ